MRYPQCGLVYDALLLGDGLPRSFDTGIGVHMLAQALEMTTLVALPELCKELVVGVRLAGRHASRSEVDPERARLQLVVRMEFACGESRHDRLQRRCGSPRACRRFSPPSTGNFAA